MTESHLNTKHNNSTFLNIEVLRQILPDTAKAKELLLRFKPTLQCELDAIEHGFAKHEWDTVRTHLHRIRSGSLYLGIESVGFPAATLEEQLDLRASQDQITAAWSNLYEACQDYITQTDAELLALLDGIQAD